MTRRILILGEGATELRAVGDRWTGCGQALISRLLGCPPTSLVAYEQIVLSNFRKSLESDDDVRARGEDEQARIGRKIASLNAQGLLLLRDNDRSERRAHGPRRPAIERGFAEAAQQGYAVPAVLALAVECMEAWALADPDAWERVFGKVPSLPSEPEALWGDVHDPESNHPKCVMRRCFAQIGRQGAPAQLLEHASFAQIARRCPSFQQFVDDFYRAFPSIECIVAAGQDRAIGVDGEPPWGFEALRDHLHHERSLLRSSAKLAVVWGRKTWQTRALSLPDDCADIVVTRDPSFSNGVASFDAAVRHAVSLGATRIFVLGGASLYREALDHFRCTELHYTSVDDESPGADARFPALDASWARGASPTSHRDNGFDYQIERWSRFAPQLRAPQR